MVRADNATVSQVSKRRTKIREELTRDPYLGFNSLDDALEAARFTSQPEVLARLLNRENVFISGLAGSGKTTVINRFIDMLDAEHEGAFTVAITASTGIAATLIGGQTLHSWAGFGISTEPFDRTNISPTMKRKRSIFCSTDVLIIDEISMLPAYLFIKLDEMLQYFRGNKMPFGGIQLVLIGDFLQLPPVARAEDDHLDTRFAIETSNWREANLQCCFLDKSYRATDNRLKRMLLEIAANKVSDETRRLIAEREEGKLDPNKAYTTLFTTNKNVDDYNRQKLRENPNPQHEWQREVVKGSQAHLEKLIKSQSIPETVSIKRDAIVMLTKNILDEDMGLFLPNGSLGVVQSITKYGVRVRFNQGGTYLISPFEYTLTEKASKDQNGKTAYFPKVVAAVKQLPLKLGYAITVHKSQGQTFDGVVTDLSRCFQPGLGYVALSRVRSIDDLIIAGFSEEAWEVGEMSQRITIYVKKKSILARREFLEKREYYEELLDSYNARSVQWDPAEAGAAVQARKEARRKSNFA